MVKKTAEEVQLEVLQPEPQEVVIRGEALSITPFRYKHYRKLKKPLGMLAAGIINMNTSSGELTLTSILALITSLIEEYGVIMELATGKDADWVDDLLPDEFIKLMEAIIKANSDYFFKQVKPLLSVLLPELTGQQL